MATKDYSTHTNSGIGFVGLLQVVFIVLKLVQFEGNVVNGWSWWLVWSPFLVSIGLWVLFMVIFVIAVLIREVRN